MCQSVVNFVGATDDFLGEVVVRHFQSSVGAEKFDRIYMICKMELKQLDRGLSLTNEIFDRIYMIYKMEIQTARSWAKSNAGMNQPARFLSVLLVNPVNSSRLDSLPPPPLQIPWTSLPFRPSKHPHPTRRGSRRIRGHPG